MKTVENKIVEVTVPSGEKSKISYRELIEACTNHFDGQGGMGVTEMRNRQKVIDVLDKLEKDSKEIEFEDAVFENVTTYVENMKWAFRSPEFIKFSDYVDSIK